MAVGRSLGVDKVTFADTVGPNFFNVGPPIFLASQKRKLFIKSLIS